MAQELLSSSLIPWIYDPVQSDSWSWFQKEQFAEEVSIEGIDPKTKGVAFAWSTLDGDFASGEALRHVSQAANLSYMNCQDQHFQELLANYDEFLYKSTVIYSAANSNAFRLFESTC